MPPHRLITDEDTVYTSGGSYGALATRVHMSRRTFEQRFTAATGDAPDEYVQKLCIEAANRILEMERETFEQITLQVGYEDAASFRKLFSKHVGVSPSANRKMKLRVSLAPTPHHGGFIRSLQLIFAGKQIDAPMKIEHLETLQWGSTCDKYPIPILSAHERDAFMTGNATRLLFHRDIYTELIEKTVLHARHTVWIATADLKDMHIKMARGYKPILALFDDMAQKGVQFRIIHAKLPTGPFRDTLSSFPRLTGGALELQVCPRSHWKIVIVDGETGYMGSANFTGAGMGVKKAWRRNHEAGLLTTDPAMVQQLSSAFDRFWMGEHCENCAYRSDCPDPII